MKQSYLQEYETAIFAFLELAKNQLGSRFPLNYWRNGYVGGDIKKEGYLDDNQTIYLTWKMIDFSSKKDLCQIKINGNIQYECYAHYSADKNTICYTPEQFSSSWKSRKGYTIMPIQELRTYFKNQVEKGQLQELDFGYVL